jgi:hypothetical protein
MNQMKAAIGKIPTESIALHRKGHWFKSSIAHHRVDSSFYKISVNPTLFRLM